MRSFARVLIVVTALAVTGAVSHAQNPSLPVRPGGRGAPADSARRQAMKQRFQSLTPEQKAAMKQHAQAARAEQKLLSQEVKSGQITRQQARMQMRAWQKANRVPKPTPLTKRPTKPSS